MKTVRATLCMLMLLCSVLVHAQIPVLSSHPSASATVYLDFDGQYVTGTSWNWSGPINAQPAQLTTAAIMEIFQRVAEDYRIFNVNITTDSTAYAQAPIANRMRVIITPTSSWYGNAGGVAYVGSFTWGDGTPAWVFSNLLGNNTKYIAEATSHEAGHTLGLQHQSTYNASCAKTAEYSGGQGAGEIGWAPIMGVGYYKNLTTWHLGSNAVGCNVIQNDINVIAGGANGFGLRNDEHANTHDAATTIVPGSVSFSISGIVNNAVDKDVFRLELTHNQNLKLTAVPQSVGADNAGANIDIRISLLNADADTIGRYNPSLLLNAGIDTNLQAGTYYIVSEGTGNANLGDYGSVGYYYMNGALNNVLPVHRIRLTGSAANQVHALGWSYVTDEPLRELELQLSKDGIHFEKMRSFEPSARGTTHRAPAVANTFYRVKAVVAADERAYYSNIVALHEKQSGQPFQLMTTSGGRSLNIHSTGRYQYQLLMHNGQLLQWGNLSAGLNRIDVKPSADGMLLLRVFDGTQYWTEKFIKH
jgi:hypothetical protein